MDQLELVDFRNYTSRAFDFDEGVNVVWGKNASGKTNLLEAVYLLGTGNSFKAKIIDEMVRFGQELGRVRGRLSGPASAQGYGVAKDDGRDLEVMVTKGMVVGVKTLKRKYLIDGTSKRKRDYVGYLPVVVFRPEDMDMLTGGPDLRRTFMDEVLCQVSESFSRSLSVYIQALRRRNRLLDAIREGAVNRYSLAFWDGLLIKHGNVISAERENLINHINSLWKRSELFNDLKLSYEKSAVSETRLAQYKDEELAAGYTLVGPHKDDFRVLAGDERPATAGRDLGIYGSRGEQRMAVLALKLGEIYFGEEKVSDKPLLLLDDIFSELDDVHKKEVLRVMQGRQVIVTMANKEDVSLLKDAKVIELS
ncbi:MAG: DNA replication and repair protein RecF [Microgenomates group bacterium]